MLLGVVSVLHVGAAAIVAIVPLGWILRSFVWAALAISFHRTLRLQRLRARAAVTGLEWDGDGSWAIRLSGDATWHSCRLVDRWVHPYIVILRLRRDGARRAVNVVIAADSVAAEPFRRLRARLRLEHAAA